MFANTKTVYLRPKKKGVRNWLISDWILLHLKFPPPKNRPKKVRNGTYDGGAMSGSRIQYFRTKIEYRAQN